MTATRVSDVTSFLAMDVLAEANRMAADGVDVARLEVGEPDRGPPLHAREAMNRALAGGRDRYTATEGIPVLREAIAERYRRDYGVTVDPERILVTMGVSPALLLVFLAVVNAGDEVLLPDPGYACYPNLVSMAGAGARFYPLRSQDGFLIDVDRVLSMAPDARVFMLNSPSNPTGKVQPPQVLERLAAEFRGVIISDEIYHGLTYGTQARSILEFTDDAFVLDGFSKRYGMTGWRLGYVIAPERFVDPLRRIHTNTMLSASEFVQEAGVAVLEGPQDCVAEMVESLGRRRRTIIDGLRAAGLTIEVEPEGAFYVLADARAYTDDSLSFALRVLREAHVAAGPGIDFGSRAEGFLRFCYAASEGDIRKAVDRLTVFLSGL